MSVMRDIRRVVFDISQTEMAKIACVGQASVSRWENGGQEPTREELARIRSEAVRRGLPWSDAWFFEPAVMQKAAAEAAQPERAA